MTVNAVRTSMIASFLHLSAYLSFFLIDYPFKSPIISYQMLLHDVFKEEFLPIVVFESCDC